MKDDNAKTVRSHTYSLGSNSNYILTEDKLTLDGGTVSKVKQWFDGLGRPLETVDMGAGTSGKHLVTLTEYDRAGRTSKQWLPYATTSDYVAPSTLKSGISSANYGGDSRPYTEMQYEASTLGRALKEYAPGDDWASHPKTMEYLSNTASGVLACKVYGVSTANALTGGSSYYAAGELSVVKASDEDGNTVYTFTDKQGQKLLERAVNGIEYLDTYYVYDNYGNLCFVLQPMYQTTADLNLYAFQYKYDTLKRCIWKKLPGASGVTQQYDSADRLIFSKDGNGKWTWYEYDNLGRLTKQGENTTNAVTTTPYLQHYYDDYEDFIAVAGSDFANDTGDNSYGCLTGTVQTVLGTSTKLYTAYYYDNLGQAIKVVKSNLLGGYDVTEMTYTSAVAVIKAAILKSQARATQAVNQKLPGLRGFSETSLKKMRQFYEQWQILEIRPPMAGDMETTGNEDVLETNVITSLNRPPMAGGLYINDFLSISFTHHDEILSKTSTLEERVFYIHKAATLKWDKYTLRNNLKADLFHHQGDIPNNFWTIILCKEANKAFVEYVLQDYNSPMGVATYARSVEQLKALLPPEEELKKLIDNSNEET